MPDFAGFKFPYRVINNSEALGVWRSDIDKVEETALELGAEITASTSAKESNPDLIFIVRISQQLCPESNGWLLSELILGSAAFLNTREMLQIFGYLKNLG